MQPLILHIPHAATNIPLMEGYYSPDNLEKEILKLTDWYTEDLFHSPSNISIQATFSRIFCDVERFYEDDKEVMSKFGMGALYSKYDNGEDLRLVTPGLREKVLSEYYWPHHQNLFKAVASQLKAFNSCLIIDCHSFPDNPFKSSINKRLDRPDFNIGTDSFHTPHLLVEKAKEYFKDLGYTLGIDWPYSGSMVPAEYYKTNKNVNSIMLEVNRRLYLKKNTNIKSDNYYKIKEAIQEFLILMRDV
jgi:N-formylglutamate amidohydrolase